MLGEVSGQEKEEKVKKIEHKSGRQEYYSTLWYSTDNFTCRKFMAVQEQYLAEVLDRGEALIGAGEIVDQLIRRLANKKLFLNERINKFMSQVVTGALGTEEEYPAEPWLITAVDENDWGLKTTVNIDRDKKYLVVSAGFSRLQQTESDIAKAAIADFIYQTTLWFTWGRRYGPTVGPRADWAESRKQSFLKTVEQQPQLLTELLNE